MKTIVYIDGYNLYYSRLKHSPYKWLDLFSLFSNILNERSSSNELLRVKFFTADIKAKFASHGQSASQAQQRYHQALAHGRSGPVSIIKGRYIATKAKPMRYQTPPVKEDKVEVWKLEEKQTDVNIALELYRDAHQRAAEQLVLCTNDSDLSPALKLIKNDYPHIILGLVLPLGPSTQRTQTKTLTEQADWVRKTISDTELTRAQFKDRVATGKKPADKPSYW